MDAAFYEQLRNSNAGRRSRDANKEFILRNPENLSDLLILACDSSNKNSHKAAWILELIAETHLDWLIPHIDLITGSLKTIKNESARRPFSKIGLLLVQAHANQSNPINLTEHGLQLITETAFDWLIGDAKVATKAHAMRTLYAAGAYLDWIWPELRCVISEDFIKQSAAYKAAAKEILKKMNRIP